VHIDTFIAPLRCVNGVLQRSGIPLERFENRQFEKSIGKSRQGILGSSNTPFFFSYEHLQHLASTRQSFGGQHYVHTLFNQIESINFAKDWQTMGLQPGGKLYKKSFAELVYEKHTGRAPPVSSGARKEEVLLFKAFKAKLQITIKSRNYLYDLYQKVCISIKNNYY
jgi:hypothetical protein